MNANIITQIIGYSASVFLIISFLAKDQYKLRIINLLGCICFVVYGCMLDFAWPIIIPNSIIAITQIYHVWIRPINKRKQANNNQI